MPEVIKRAEAKRLGLVRYYTGKPCKNGHASERFVNSRHCSVCDYERSADWKRQNPDVRAAQLGMQYARRTSPSSIVRGYTVKDFIPIYAASREATRTTGVPHQVDHIIPLLGGGKHIPSNLRVVTQAENRSRVCR